MSQSALGNGLPSDNYTFPPPRQPSMAGTKRARLDEDEGDYDDDDAFDPDFEAPGYTDEPNGHSDNGEPMPSTSNIPPQLPTPPTEDGTRSVGPAKGGRGRMASNNSEGGERERKSINIAYITDKSRRHITFSKRKAGIMKKVRLAALCVALD